MRKVILFALLIPLSLIGCESSHMRVREAHRIRLIEQIERTALERDERSRTGFEQFSKEEGIYFPLVEVKPTFMGDSTEVSFRDFLASSVRYPLEAFMEGISGRVMVGFIIDTDGSIASAHVIRSVHPLLDDEAIRVVMSSPKWTPGIHEGEPVRVKHTIPFSFQNNTLSFEQAIERYILPSL